MSACEHDWTERGSGPDDRWRECWLCGKTDDLPDSVPTVREAGDEGIAAVVKVLLDNPPVSWDFFPEPDLAIEQIANHLAPLIAEREAKAWDRGHRTYRRLGPDNCKCSAWSESECGCGEYGTNVITPNPFRSALAPETPEAGQ